MGYFVGDVVSKWLVEPKKKLPWYKRWTSWVFDWDEDRKMELLEDFKYVDDNGDEWIAYKGDIVDGASIPKPFQLSVGSPLVGDYRRASVIHDVYCQRKDRSYQSVHKVFCEMMLADDVAFLKRKRMCFAVKRFGPRW